MQRVALWQGRMGTVGTVQGCSRPPRREWGPRVPRMLSPRAGPRPASPPRSSLPRRHPATQTRTVQELSTHGCPERPRVPESSDGGSHGPPPQFPPCAGSRCRWAEDDPAEPPAALGAGASPSAPWPGACCAVSCHAMLCRAVLCRAMLFHAMPCRAMPCHTMPCRAIPCHAVPYHAVPCCSMPCHAMPCPAVPCSAVPYRAVLYHAMPYCSMPCRAVPACIHSAVSQRRPRASSEHPSYVPGHLLHPDIAGRCFTSPCTPLPWAAHPVCRRPALVCTHSMEKRPSCERPSLVPTCCPASPPAQEQPRPLQPCPGSASVPCSPRCPPHPPRSPRHPAPGQHPGVPSLPQFPHLPPLLPRLLAASRGLGTGTLMPARNRPQAGTKPPPVEAHGEPLPKRSAAAAGQQHPQFPSQGAGGRSRRGERPAASAPRWVAFPWAKSSPASAPLPPRLRQVHFR